MGSPSFFIFILFFYLFLSLLLLLLSSLYHETRTVYGQPLDCAVAVLCIPRRSPPVIFNNYFAIFFSISISIASLRRRVAVGCRRRWAASCWYAVYYIVIIIVAVAVGGGGCGGGGGGGGGNGGCVI